MKSALLSTLLKRVKIIFENLLNISKNFQMKFLTKYLTYWKDNINIQNENIETNIIMKIVISAYVYVKKLSIIYIYEFNEVIQNSRVSDKFILPNIT